MKKKEHPPSSSQNTQYLSPPVLKISLFNYNIAHISNNVKHFSSELFIFLKYKVFFVQNSRLLCNYPKIPFFARAHYL